MGEDKRKKLGDSWRSLPSWPYIRIAVTTVRMFCRLLLAETVLAKIVQYACSSNLLSRDLSKYGNYSWIGHSVTPHVIVRYLLTIGQC